MKTFNVIKCDDRYELLIADGDLVYETDDPYEIKNWCKSNNIIPDNPYCGDTKDIIMEYIIDILYPNMDRMEYSDWLYALKHPYSQTRKELGMSEDELKAAIAKYDASRKW